MLFDWLSRGAWLTRRRVIALGSILLVLQVAVLAFLVAGSQGLVKRYGPNTVSFVGFYAAGQLAAEGHPEFAYDELFHRETEEALTGPGVRYLPFLYPPVYLLLCAPLALRPFLPAFIVFEAATLVIYLLVVRRILDARRRVVAAGSGVPSDNLDDRLRPERLLDRRAVRRGDAAD